MSRDCQDLAVAPRQLDALGSAPLIILLTFFSLGVLIVCTLIHMCDNNIYMMIMLMG
jgi:hypothetical protein